MKTVSCDCSRLKAMLVEVRRREEGRLNETAREREIEARAKDAAERIDIQAHKQDGICPNKRWLREVIAFEMSRLGEDGGFGAD
jgi:hypothetical protein